MNDGLSQRAAGSLEQILPAASCARRAALAWEVAVRSFDIPPWLLPAPTDICASSRRTARPLVSHRSYHAGGS